MRSIRAIAFFMLGSALAVWTGGCPSNPGGNGNSNSGNSGPSQLEGRWSGSLACSRTQALNGSATPAVNSTKTLSIELDVEGKPTTVTIITFSGAPDQTAALREVGDSVTLNYTHSGTTVTQVVTVSEASYTTTQTRLVLDSDYSATAGASTQTGTGTQTILVRLVNGTVEYSADVDYDIQFIVSTVSLPTSETTTCSGALTRQ